MNNRKNFISEALKRIRNGDHEFEIEAWQRRPCTAVRVTYSPQGTFSYTEGLGFAKVSWPDEWNEDIGQEIAIVKALAHIWRQIMKEPTPENP